MRKKTILTILSLGLLLLTVTSASAVQFGQPDGNAHPYVGLLVFDVNGTPTWRCSGTLLSPTVMVTAGHCTYGTSGGRVWFESDVESGIPGNGYPSGGGTSIEFKEIHTHPNFVSGAFYLYDVGVVILKKPVKVGTYGTFAPVGLIDQLATQRGQQDQTFTVVGYGLQSVVPTLQQDRVRYQGTVQLINANSPYGIPTGTSASFTNDPGQGTGPGGTCFGDSGGPIFYSNTTQIAAITSFGVNANCAGTGGGYRLDTADDQAFISQFLH